jgi:hypothetical protein
MNIQQEKMDQRVKQLWVDELRNGGHEQGTGYLKRQHPGNDTPEYCCLGILCEIAVREGVIAPAVASAFEAWVDTIYSYEGGENKLLPRDVQRWAGLEGADVKVELTDDEGPRFLAGINDTGIPFTVIADLIEKQL